MTDSRNSRSRSNSTAAPAVSVCKRGETAQHDLVKNLGIGVPSAFGRCHRLEEGANVPGVAVKGENAEMFPGQVQHAPRLWSRTVQTGETADGGWFVQGRSGLL